MTTAFDESMATEYFDPMDALNDWLETDTTDDWRGEAVFTNIACHIHFEGHAPSGRPMWSTEIEQWDHEQRQGDYYCRPMRMWQPAGIYVTKVAVVCAAAELVLHVHRDQVARTIEIV